MLYKNGLHGTLAQRDLFGQMFLFLRGSRFVVHQSNARADAETKLSGDSMRWKEERIHKIRQGAYIYSGQLTESLVRELFAVQRSLLTKQTMQAFRIRAFSGRLDANGQIRLLFL